MNGRFTSEQLKKIAMGTMFLDHAAHAVVYGGGLHTWSPLAANIGTAMRLIGRMAFPLYAFLLVQGFLWTRDWKKYVSRMFLFAVVSEIPFDLVLAGEVYYPHGQNTIITLTIGLICMKLLDVLGQKYKLSRSLAAGSGRSSDRDFSTLFVGYVLAAWVMAVSLTAAAVLRSDYGAGGVFLIVLLYIFRHEPAILPVAGGVGLFGIYGFDVDLFFAWIAFFLISRYNGERGRRMGYFPYVFYPTHLLALWFVGKTVATIMAAGV